MPSRIFVRDMRSRTSSSSLIASLARQDLTEPEPSETSDITSQCKQTICQIHSPGSFANATLFPFPPLNEPNGASPKSPCPVTPSNALEPVEPTYAMVASLGTSTAPYSNVEVGTAADRPTAFGLPLSLVGRIPRAEPFAAPSSSEIPCHDLYTAPVSEHGGTTR